MSRSGYSDDCDNLALYRQAVDAAILGRRGQAILKRLREALDAMPVKRLIAGEIKNASGEVCAFGALDPNAPAVDEWDDDAADRLALHFHIARSLAAEIVYVNDEQSRRRYWQDIDNIWRSRDETPEERWARMREWVQQNIGPDLDAEAERQGGTTPQEKG